MIARRLGVTAAWQHSQRPCRSMDLFLPRTSDGQIRGIASTGISLGDVLGLPQRHPACRRREAQPSSCMKRENLSLRCQGRHPSGAHHKDQSTDAERRAEAARSRDEGSVMEPDRRSCLALASLNLRRSTIRQRIATVHKISMYCTVVMLRVRNLWQKRASDWPRQSLKIEQFGRDQLGFPAPCPSEAFALYAAVASRHSDRDVTSDAFASEGDKSPSALRHRLFAIHHPGRAEFVGHHAETLRPECLPDRHSYCAAFRKFTEDALGFSGIVHRDAHAEPLRL